ncbi:hypothetical protein [Pasteurella multocida]|uniref:hypothetical protein n=1 Tax=Pasteurella multocida TaxID=747 RepID=UPI00099E0DA9|nr:hypothetical protein [Pasteurella multocida]MCL7767034.1 hypothetical protein [Pasteurella multocida]MCL7825104.1 hypothetical protein [Pasteurella multocida]MCL7827865.1 hypothetical protein [Pasteurella multocida]MCL7833922.1 hypothetical protein [Pasteurella multocida]NNI31461.1 hypothetical protein [Pasteurella multocida]
MFKKTIRFLKKLDEENKKMGNFKINFYENKNIDNLVNINGLPMNNGIDAAGNPFGCNSQRDKNYNNQD